MRFGLTKHEARVYRALLTVREAKAAEIAAMTGIQRPHVYVTLRRLLDKGLISHGKGKVGVFSAIAPEVVFSETLRRRRIELREQTEMLRELSRAYRLRMNPVGTAAAIEVLRTPPGRTSAGFEDRLECVKRAEREILFLTKMHLSEIPLETDRKLLGRMDRAEIAAMRRGVICRCVFQADYLNDPWEQERERVLVKAGEQARVVESVPMNMVVIDRRWAWFRPGSVKERGVTYKVNDSVLCEVLASAFEYYWQLGEDVTCYLQRHGKRPKKKKEEGIDE